jgi:Activator of Hsp90 ATPase homolog 1-like protein
MATRRRQVRDLSPQQVWDVLCDGWVYPVFVVGTSGMRAVDRGWPAVGTRLHHAFGAWPVMVQDSTVVRACEPPRRLEMVARGWPIGEATVEIELEPKGDSTLVSITEDASSGPGRLVPRPVRAVAIWLRNGETLRRLEHLARGRAGLGDPPGAD